MKNFPSVFYGTAWKKQRTAELVQLALKSGFRAIDTACQPKHYYEPGVGEGILKSGIPRDQIFIQTKFTPIDGQDPNKVPYDPKSQLKVQVRTSLQVSLKNLKTDYLDSLVLHSPLSLPKTLQVWQVFQQFIKNGKVKHLGLSNCYNINFFKAFYQKTEIKPTFLQNRFYKQTNYDQQLRKFCRQNKVYYQSFWTLTANPHILQSKQMKQLSKKYSKTPQQLLYSILIKQDIIPLIGTTSSQHMQQDLQALKIVVSEQDRELILKQLK